MIDYPEHKGAIWELCYYTAEKANIPDAEKQRFLDRQTNEMNGMFDPPPGLSPTEYSNLFMNHFLKSREKSRDLIDKNSTVKVRVSEMFQIGNRECLDQISRIESSSNFHSWENPSLVDSFKYLSK